MTAIPGFCSSLAPATCKPFWCLHLTPYPMASNGIQWCRIELDRKLIDCKPGLSWLGEQGSENWQKQDQRKELTSESKQSYPSSLAAPPGLSVIVSQNALFYVKTGALLSCKLHALDFTLLNELHSAWSVTWESPGRSQAPIRFHSPKPQP